MNATNNTEESTMTKAEIMNRTESGLGVDGRDVATVSASGRYVELRHEWPENVDARVWSGVKSAAGRLCQEIADKTGRDVELYAVEGHVVDVYEPRC
jgi:hypothetical protein